MTHMYVAKFHVKYICTWYASRQSFFKNESFVKRFAYFVSHMYVYRNSACGRRPTCFSICS